jgi:hypothetical protein
MDIFRTEGSGTWVGRCRSAAFDARMVWRGRFLGGSDIIGVEIDVIGQNRKSQVRTRVAETRHTAPGLNVHLSQEVPYVRLGVTGFD